MDPFPGPYGSCDPFAGSPPSCSLFCLFSLSTGLGVSLVVGWGWSGWGLVWGLEGLVLVFAFFFSPHRFSPIGFGFLGGGEEEAADHLVKGGLAWVLHPDNTTLVAMDTANGAHLHTPGVGDVGDGPDDWVLGTVAHLGGWVVGLTRGGRGGLRVCVVLGAGVAFVLGVGW